jgi:hypothetical protein
VREKWYKLGKDTNEVVQIIKETYKPEWFALPEGRNDKTFNDYMGYIAAFYLWHYSKTMAQS